jgi:hypothetical protein
MRLVPETAGEPLGLDAMERPTPEDVEVVWRAALQEPVPDYEGLTLEALRNVRRAGA